MAVADADGGAVAVLLAAGRSTRLGTPKQLLLDAGGEPLVRRMARELLAGGCARVVVVTGGAATEVAAACAGMGPGVTLVFNGRFAEGMGTSIAAGVAALETPAAVLVATCDMPAVDAAHIRALLTLSDGGRRRVASTYLGAGDEGPPVLGVPALFPTTDVPALLALTGDRGARELLKQNDTLSVFLQDGSLDLDTPADIARWHEASGRPGGRSPSSPPPMASTLFATALGDLEYEFAQTRRMLERVPQDHLAFTPHAKSWALDKVARHLCDFPEWALYTLQSTELNFDEPMPRKAIPTDAADFVKLWDEGVAALKAHLPQVTDADLGVEWRALAGGQVVIKGTRAEIIRGMVINHMIHHRAQLTIYYRLVGVPVPGLYGPSADEQ